MEVAAVENMDTSSPPASPIATGTNLTDDQSKKYESDDSTGSSENSNGPLENNNEGSSHSDNDKTKRNGITPDDSQCSNSKESINSQPKLAQEKLTNENPSSSKAKEILIGISDNESRNHTNDEGTDDESPEGVDSSDEGSEDGSEEPEPKEAVSVNSDSEPETVEDDSSRDEQSETENCDIVMIENTNEVHEIVSDDDDDDCVVTNDEGMKTVNGGSILDNDSDIEESAEDPLNHNDSKINNANTKSLLKPSILDQINAQKDGTSLVIVDTDSILSGKGPTPLQSTKVNSPTSPQNSIESMPTRGANTADITIKSVNATTSTQAQTPSAPLLPTLTDDMFVVEAPSFIVPYVYEKPSTKPFREFVDVLGKELDEQREKEEKERLEKEKEILEKEKELLEKEKELLEKEKEKRKKEREERRAKGEEVEDSDEEVEKKDEEVEKKDEEVVEPKPDEEEPKEKKGEKKKWKGRKKNDDDASWDGESDVDSEEPISEDDELTTVVIKDKDEDDIDEIKTIATTNTVTTDTKPAGVKSETFFDNNLGKFFMNIGLNLVQEYVQTDLLKQQKRKYRKERRSQRPNTRAIESAIGYLSKNLEFSKAENAPYKFKQKSCKFCTFRTESALIMSHHLETPHMKNNVYVCNFCTFEVRSPHDILFHMEAEHNTRSRLERAPAYHQCANCPFEDNGKGKLARHLIACAKKFKPDLNLAPPADWEPPAKIPKLTRARVNLVAAYNRSQGSAPLGRPPTISGSPAMVGRPRGPAPGGGAPRGSFLTGAPLMRAGMMMRHVNPAPMPMNFPLSQNSSAGKIVHQPSISITPLPRAPQPQQPAARTQGSFVICEICDGYIKDLEQLRSHMHWIHKVKIHPKMIYNRPPLNCQKCQFRFFTDQGLERHLLGSHGLVTSSMQETANQGKDSGRCPVCGRVYQWKLLNHVAKDHSMTLKPAHLSYKCTVCTATFGMYKQFESHVYSMHSAVGKKIADSNKPPAPAPAPLRTLPNSSITIVPTGKAAAK